MSFTVIPGALSVNAIGPFTLNHEEDISTIVLLRPWPCIVISVLTLL